MEPNQPECLVISWIHTAGRVPKRVARLNGLKTDSPGRQDRAWALVCSPGAPRFDFITELLPPVRMDFCSCLGGAPVSVSLAGMTLALGTFHHLTLGAFWFVSSVIGCSQSLAMLRPEPPWLAQRENY